MNFLMKIALTLLIFRNVNSNENHLASMVTDFSTLLRLANGLSFQTDILSRNLMSEVILDLSYPERDESLLLLSKLDVGIVVQEFEKLDKHLQNAEHFPSLQDFDIDIRFGTVEEISESLDVTKKYAEDFIEAIDEINGKKYNTDCLTSFAESMDTVFSADDYQKVKEAYSKFVENYRAYEMLEEFYYSKLMNTIKIKHNDIFKAIHKLQSLTEVFLFLEASRSNFESERILSETIDVLKDLSNSKNSRQNKLHLLNDIRDIQLVFEDLKGGKLNKLLGVDENIEKIKTALRFLEKIPGEVQKMQKLGTEATHKTKLKTMGNLFEAYQNVINVKSSLKNQSWEDVHQCMTEQARNNFKLFLDETVAIEKSAKDLDSLFERIKYNPMLERDKLDQIRSINETWRQIVESSGNDTEKMKDINLMIENYAELLLDISEITTIPLIMEPYFAHENLVKSIYDQRLKQHIDNMTGSSRHFVVIECIEKYAEGFATNSINFDLVGDAEFLKANSLNSTEYFKEVVAMQKAIAGVREKYRRASRSRREVQVPYWKDATKHVEGFSKGVEILSHFSKILEHEESLKVIAKSGDEVNAVIEGIPEVKMMWTKSYKKKILDLIKKVRILNKKAGELRKNETRRFSEIFEEAHDFWGAPIDLKLLADKAAGILTNSSESGAQEVADSLQKVSDLQLDFSGCNPDLSLAKGSIESFWEYLDQIYGDKKSVRVIDDKKSVGVVRKWRRETTSFTPEPTDTAMFFCIFIPTALLIFLVIICSLCWYDKRKQRKQRELEDPILCSRYLAFQEEKFKREKEHVRCLLQAVENDDLASARLFVEQGAWINAIRDTYTCLHIASTLTLNPSMVSLLIRNGANRRALNRNYRTAWEEVEEEIATCQEILSEVKTKGRKRKDTEQRIQKLKAVDLVFQRFEGKKFSRILPELMPTSEFRIYVDQSCGGIPELHTFTDKFPNLICFSHGEATHVIVGTTNGTFQMKIDNTYHWVSLFGRSMLMDGSAWVKAILKKGEKALRNDYKYRIKKVQVGSSTYDGYQVELAHRDWHMRVVPILQDVVIIGDDFLKYFPSHDSDVLKKLFKSLGATWHDQFPSLVKYNHKITHPYHFFDTPLFWRPIRNVEIQNPDLPRPLKNPPIPGPKKFRTAKKTDVFFEMDWMTLIGMLLERNYTYDPEMEPRKTVLRMDGDPVQETSEMLKKMKKVMSEKILKVKADDTSTDRTHESIDMNWTE